MVAERIGREKDFAAGAIIGSVVKKMVIPVSNGTPSGADQGWVWIDTSGIVSLAYHDGTDVILIPITGATTEAVQDIVGPFLNGDLGDIVGTYDDAGNAVSFVVDARAITYAKMQAVSATSRVLGRITSGSGSVEELTGTNIRTILGSLDADTLGGQSSAAIQAAVINAITNGAGGAYDTLVEIQALLQGDDTAISGLTTSVAARSRFWAGAIPNGSPTATLTHNLGLSNIHDYTIKTFVTATGVTEEYANVGATLNTITLTDETGANIASGRRAFITAGV